MKKADKPSSITSRQYVEERQPYFNAGAFASANPFFAPIQPKLEIGSPDDDYEREADTMAEKALQHLANPTLSAPTGIQRKCADCEEDEKLHRKEDSSAEPTTSPGLANQLNSSVGGGFQLRPGIRSNMESAFGSDFSQVRLHTDTVAVQMAQHINAQAFTYGNDIYFNAGKYNTDSQDGKRLLAHELTHVVQQGTKLRRKRIQRLPGSPAGGCGLCYGSPKAVGIAAHTLIQKAFLARYRYLLKEHSMPILAPSPTDEENGRLDLAELEQIGKINIGEIKPANVNGAAQGAADIIWYKKQLELLGMEVGYLNLPPPLEGIPFPTLAAPPCTPTQLLFVDPPVNGVYTYWCTPDYKDLIKTCKCISQPDTDPYPIPYPIPFPVPEGEKKTNPRDTPVGEPERIPPLIPVAVGAALLTAAAYVAGRAGFSVLAKGLARRFPPVAVASAAAALLVLIAYSDRVYASPGPGEDPLESLYKAAAANGTPIPPALQEVIKNNPELRSIAENAAKSGDITAAQDALNRQLLETINNNLDQFTEEDLQILMSMAGSGGESSTNAPTVEQLKAAIERKRSGIPATPDAANGATANPPVTATTPAAPAGQERFPAVSSVVQAQFNGTSAPARELFKAMVSNSGNGPSVNDEAILRFLQTVPGDLTLAEARQLIQQLSPVSGESLDDIMQRLGQAIQTLRSPQPTGNAGSGDSDAGSSEAEGPTGQAQAVQTGDTITASEFNRQMMEVIQQFTGWDNMSNGRTVLLATGDRDFGSVTIPGVVHAYAYTKVNATVFAVTFVQIRLTRRSGTRPGSTWRGTLVSATTTVANNGRTAQLYRVGNPVNGSIIRRVGG